MTTGARQSSSSMAQQRTTSVVNRINGINGIKDGLHWDDALKQKYGVTAEQLVHAYGISMGVADLKFE